MTVTLSKSKNALGYDAILGKKLSKNKYETRPVDYGKFVKKNQKTTTIVFKNVPKGTYYVGAHAFNRTAGDSSKVFGNWTVPKKIKVK